MLGIQEDNRDTAIYGLVVSHLNGLFGDRVSPSKPHWSWLSYAIVYLSLLLNMVQGSPSASECWHYGGMTLCLALVCVLQSFIVAK